jgi:Fe-S-cluster containining protein
VPNTFFNNLLETDRTAPMRNPRLSDDEDDPELLSRRLRERRALKGLDCVYRTAADTLRRFRCAKSAQCCQLRNTGREPYLFPVEWMRIVAALRAAGRSIPEPRPDGACAFLSSDRTRCAIYEDRPFGCRTFFCHRVKGPGEVPTAPLYELSARVTAVSDALDPGAELRRLTELLEAHALRRPR